jgi:urease accessory protein
LITYTHIIGSAAQTIYADKLHALEHANNLDYVSLSSEDIQRKRLKVVSYKGRECGIALPREQKLYDGAILSLAENYALIVRCQDVKWLRCTATDAATALELGYFAGNMHWSVRFDKNILEIELKGRPEDYAQRLAHLLADGRITLESRDA